MDLKGTNTIINLLNAGYSAEDIAKVAAKEEKELSKAAKMKTITKARDKLGGLKICIMQMRMEV